MRRWRIACTLAALVGASAGRPVAAQDTVTLDRGVRIGITYQPGVRPGLVLLPPAAAVGPTRDSVRALLSRDLDYSDRYEMIAFAGSDSIAAGAPHSLGTPHARSAVELAVLNYPLYRALGADFAVTITRPPASDTIEVTVHDVAAGAVRRVLRAPLPALSTSGFRMAVHRLADRIVQATLGVRGMAATRVLFVTNGKLYRIDQDGGDLKVVVQSGDRSILSPDWDHDGRRMTYTEFWSGHGQLFVHDAATGKRRAVTDGKTLDFTPAFSPDGKTLVFSRAIEEGTDIYSINIRDNCCLQRLTVGRFSDNLSPTYSPDGQRIAFVSTRAGAPQVYVMAADGTDQELFAPFDYGVTGASNAPDWSPDGQSVAFHREVGGTLQVFVLDARTRTARQLTSLGRNEDPTWAPDSRHLAFVSDRSGYRQLWVIDVETGRIRPLLQQSGVRLPAWSPQLPDTEASTP